MAYEVSNPVDFYAGGDTTAQAIGKHIAEFARIYDVLNSIGSGEAVIVTSDDVVLKAGEIGFERNTGTLKVGDGSTTWGLLTGINVVEVVDNLLSDEATKALSAAQGKVLKALIDAIRIPEIVNDLTTGGPEKTLSAEQGKALKALIDAISKTEVVDDLTTGGGGKALSAEQGKVLKGIIDTLATPIPGPPGPKGIEWRGAWDSTTEYRKDDAVSYHGGSYIALKPSTGEPPSNAEFWGVLSAKGANGTGTGDMMKAVYDTDGDGKVDAAVMADTANSVTWGNITEKPEKFTCDIVDALDSDRTDAALSAKQGKVLKGQIDGKATASHQHEMDGVIGLTTALALKADLVNGKVPVAQLPDSSGGNSIKILMFPGTKTSGFYVPAGGTWIGFIGYLRTNTDGSSLLMGPPPGYASGGLFGYAWWYKSGGSVLDGTGHISISSEDTSEYTIQKIIACWKIQ